MKAEINGVELFFDVEGAALVPNEDGMDERLACFVLHGGPALDHTYFKPWLTPLTDCFQFIYVDHRGTGRSGEAALETYRLGQMADDLEGLRQHLGLDRVAVMGSSYGGFLAQTYVLRYPDSVAALYALGTAPSHRFWGPASAILEERGDEEQRRIGPELLGGRIETEEAYGNWWSTMFPLYFHRYEADLADPVVRRIRGNPRTAREMFEHDMPAYDVEAELDSIDVPTFVAVGAHDWITPPSESEIIAGKVPGAELQLYRESGHFVFIEEHAKFIDDVREFTLRRVRRAAPVAQR